MGYWSHEYLLRTWGGPMVQAEFLKEAQKPFFVPRIFSGLNLFLDKAGFLPDVVDLVAKECKTKKAFLVTDEYAVRFAGKVMSPYEKRHGIRFEVWKEARPDAPIETVKDCAEKMRKFGPDLIFALGGGSSIDTAKGAWILYEHPDVNVEILSPIIPLNLRNKAKLVAIPTTSGTGSEVSGVAVISFPDGVKLGIGGALPELVPDFALLDPTLTVGMPPQLTAGTGGDALAHAIDGFMAPRSDELNRAISLQTIKMIFEWLPRAYRDGNDLMPRIKMQQAAMMAGIPLSNVGSGISHALGHTIGGLYHIHHGAMVLLFIPYELQVYSKATDRHLEICDLLGIRDNSSDKKSLSNLIDKIRGLMSELHLAFSLKDAGIAKNDFEKNLDFILNQTPTDPAFYFGWFDLTREQLRDVFICAYDGKLLDMDSDLWR
ncbi:MAG TPA: iron-containing alcohol dehydrogenase [Smithellaceae bacterium]|nr:iron-containing alcohol dehydrogenase [Smithellaceae bacterium]HRS88874.1 iron-containing alcohol dehydrogenase [Smithellaceae bacterium]HRV26213.1 iron-containing alcohol dehydrogenase [Smithellaceae bacterium]